MSGRWVSTDLKSAKKKKISKKDMRQNWKIHIKFGIFKSKILEWVWRVLVWEESKNFIKQEVTKWRKMRHKNLPKRSDLLRRLPWSPDDFHEV